MHTAYVIYNYTRLSTARIFTRTEMLAGGGGVGCRKGETAGLGIAGIVLCPSEKVFYVSGNVEGIPPRMVNNLRSYASTIVIRLVVIGAPFCSVASGSVALQEANAKREARSDNINITEIILFILLNSP